jgi:hypothetical protein
MGMTEDEEAGVGKRILNLEMNMLSLRPLSKRKKV